MPSVLEPEIGESTPWSGPAAWLALVAAVVGHGTGLVGLVFISDERTAQVGSVGMDRAAYVGVACLVVAAVMAAIALLSHPSRRSRRVAVVALGLAGLSMAWPAIWFVAAALVSCGAGNCL